MNTNWIAIAISSLSAGVALAVGLHSMLPRPRLRTFAQLPYVRQEGEWRPIAYHLYVFNVGRAPALILSIGARTPEGGVSGKTSLTPGALLAEAYSFPMVLQPGDKVAATFPADQFGDDDTFVVQELRPRGFLRRKRKEVERRHRGHDIVSHRFKGPKKS